MKRILILTAWALLLSIQFTCTSSCNLFRFKSSAKYYKPAQNKVEIPELKILTEVLSQKHFEQTVGRTFDSCGVYMTNAKYHPVNIFQFGIFSHDMYQRTGNEIFKKQCIDQFGYFLDSTHFNRWENYGIGFPYQITFADLKPAWYSGLAQAEAIMYLIRYYNLTHDMRALKYIQDAKRFMLTPVEAGGTLKKLSDKEVWIEEYANSKSKAEVINGFVTSIMGLHEYTLMFPEDTTAKNTLAQCLYTHKKWLNKYDNGTGILYDQGNKSIVGDFYSKAQVIQMKQMYELFGDIFYKNIEMLWATYAFNKGTPGFTGCIISDTNFSSPAIIKDGWYCPSINFHGMLDTSLVDTILTSESVKRNLKFLVDNNKNTAYPFRPDDTTQQAPFIQFNLRKTVTASGWWLQVAPELKGTTGFKIYVRDNDGQSWKKIKTENTGKVESRYYFEFDKTDFRQFKIEFYGLSKSATLSITEINFIIPKSQYITYFSHFISNEFQVTDSLCNFSFARNNVDDYVVFYKTADAKERLSGAKWNVDDGIRADSFRAPKGKYCLFLVVFKNNSTDSAIGPIAY